jgi:predicted PolB exonuclease-like 3'-5' exonuclease
MIKEMDPLFVDIETTCTTDPEVAERLAEKITVPGSYSKPESIAKWEAEVKPGLVEEAMLKTALNGAYGKIVCIGLAVAEGEIEVFDGCPEKELLESLMSLASDHGAFPRLVGHNLAGFDLPFIRQRCIVNGVKLAYWFPRDVKPWSERICDTMVAWSGVRDSISLSNLAHVLGIEVAPTIKGAQVPAAYHAGRYDEIAAHCREDIRVTREVYRRIVAVE